MKSAYIKNLYREIPRSPLRFVMILVLLSIGSGLLYGQMITETSMRQSADAYYARANLFDLWLHVEKGGLTKEMAEGVRSLPGMERVQLQKQQDNMVSWRGESFPARVLSISEEDINTPALVAGRMPQSPGECLGDAHAMTETPIQIGDTVAFTPGPLLYDEMTVVGLAELPQYTKYTRGATLLGNGRIACFILVMDEAFGTETYTDFYFKVDGAAGLGHDDPAYDDAVEAASDELIRYLEDIGDPALSLLLSQREFTLGGRQLLDGYRSYLDDIDNTKRSYGIVPPLVYAVALLVCATSIMRVVDARTTDTAVLYALGEYGVRLWLPMYTFALISSIVGSVLGVIWGKEAIPRLLQGALRAKYPSLPPVVPAGNAWIAMLSICLSVVIAILATAIALYRQRRVLDARARERARSIWLEKWPQLWQKLRFADQISLRNIFRFKWRSCISLFCAMACAFLLYAVSSAGKTLEETVRVQYDVLQRYDLSVSTDENDATAQSLRTLSEILQTIEGYTAHTRAYQGMGVLSAGDAQPLMLEVMIPSGDKPFEDFFTVRDAETYAPLSLSGDSYAVLSKNAAASLGITIGDILHVTAGKHQLEVPVTHLDENHLSQRLLLSPGMFAASAGEEVAYQTLLLRAENAGEETLDAAARSLMASGCAQTVYNIPQLKAEYLRVRRPMQAALDVLALITLGFAVLIIHNLHVWAKVERRHELDTLESIGYTPFQVEVYLFRESVWIALVGIFLGFTAMFFANDWMIGRLDGSVINYVRRYYVGSFVFSGTVTLLILTGSTWLDYLFRLRFRIRGSRRQATG